MAVKAGTYRGVSAADRADERRKRLLEATLELWGRDDGARITMTRICAEAGLTERYFYEQFSGLDEALVAVVEGISDEIAATIIAKMDTPGDSGERVRAAIGAFIKILTDDPRKGRIAIVEAASLDALRPRRNQLLLQFANLAAVEARALYGEHAWSGREGELSSVIFIGGVAELVRAWIDGEVASTPEDLVEAATRHFTLTASRTGTP